MKKFMISIGLASLFLAVLPTVEAVSVNTTCNDSSLTKMREHKPVHHNESSSDYRHYEQKTSNINKIGNCH